MFDVSRFGNYAPSRETQLRLTWGGGQVKLRCLLVAVCAVLLLAPAAWGAAPGSAGKGYGGGGGVQNEVNEGALNATGSGSLPFTGLDLALLVIGGVTLLVAGAGLRRAVRRGA
jgi:hypothetical protein